MDRYARLIELLEDAENASRTGDNARFGEQHMDPVTLNTPDEVDAFVKERIRLYMGSWVTGPIVHALEILRISADLQRGINELAEALLDQRFASALDRIQKAAEANRQEAYGRI